MTTFTLLEIANKVVGNDEIGSVAVYGVDAQWFIDQFQEVIKLCPKAKTWNEHKVYETMCSLYLLEPELLVN